MRPREGAREPSQPSEMPAPAPLGEDVPFPERAQRRGLLRVGQSAHTAMGGRGEWPPGNFMWRNGAPEPENPVLGVDKVCLGTWGRSA